jgi:TolB-like protein
MRETVRMAPGVSGPAARHRVLRLLVIIPFVASLVMPASIARAAGDLDEGIQDLTQQIVPQVQRLGKKRLAVTDFADLDGQVSDLGRFVAEELSAGLVLSGQGLRVVDRQHLSKIIEEQKLSATGVTEPGAVQKLGQLAGAEVIVAGSVVDMGEWIRIIAKILSTTTGEIIGAAETTVPDDAAVHRILGQNGSVRPVAAAPPHAGGRILTPLGEVRVLSAAPDGYRFSYVSKLIPVAGRVVRGGLLVFPLNGQTRLAYDLENQYDEFDATVGVPDATTPSVQVIFRVYADGALIYPGHSFRAGDASVPVRVVVRGVRTLMLEVDGTGIPEAGPYLAYALWGEPGLVRR